MPLLDVRNLTTTFPIAGKACPVVEGIDFTIEDGEVLAMVGESGSGKSMTALSIMGLVQAPPGCVTADAITLSGESLLDRSPSELRHIRGRRMAMIFQEPMSSLNPVFTIGRQIGEVIRRHEGISLRAARPRVQQLLELVGIPDAARRIDSYPHEMSGGMRQRVMIAIALACGPQLLIADEPTTALDVTVQAQILDLLRDLRRRLGMAVLFITHDLGLVAEFADRVLVLYAGRVVEQGRVRDIFRSPSHPYTAALLASMPALARPGEILASIAGSVPSLDALPPGCRFAPRCGFVRAACSDALPPLIPIREGHATACIRHGEGVP